MSYTNSKFQAKKIDENRYELDVRGLACPFPQLIVIKTLNDIPIGDALEVLVNNPPSIREIPPVLEKKGHKVVDISSIDHTTWKMIIHNNVELALKDKILVAVDVSDRCLETIRHITERKPFQKKRLVLYHVLNSLPHFYWDVEMEPLSTEAVAQIRDWEAEQKKGIDKFMEKAKQILLDADFPEDAVTIKIKNIEKRIAGDIVEEAKDDYMAVIISRSGTGKLPEPFLGPNAVKVIQNLSFVPVFIAGKNPPGKNILVAMDGSEGAMQAIDFVGELMGGHNFKVTLVHVVRDDSSIGPAPLYRPLPKEDLQVEEQKIRTVFDEARSRLINRGFKPDDVTSKIVTGAASRSAAIVQEAERRGYATIVLGRRGLSQSKDFFMGGVSNKVIQLGIEQAVWVVT
jgi:TusA-related sulfurtransferase/nucleotide-binding universal stress UspA family protein